MKPTWIQPTSFLCVLWLFIFTWIGCDVASSNKEPKSKKTLPLNKVNLAETTKELQSKLQSNPNLDCLTDSLMSDSLLHAQLSLFYQGRAYAPAWLTEDGVSSLAEDYLKELDSVYFDGLDPTDYNIFKRDSTLSRFKGSQELSASDWAQFDYLLSKSLLRVSHDLVLGRYYELNLKNKNWKNINDTTYVAVEAMAKTLASQDMNEAFRFMRPHHPWYHAYRKEYIWLEQRKAKSNLPSFTSMADSLSVGMNSPQLANLREFLHEIIQLPLDTSMAVCDQKLIDMLKAFQYRHQVKTTGKLDSATCNRLNKTPKQRQKMLAINMERMRWLRHTFQQPYIWSVLPRMDVEYVEHDSVQFRMRTVIGRPARATPTLDTKLENIVFSPPWIVPPTILKEDVLPGLSRRGGSYLARKGLRAYDRRGRQVSASAINGSNYRNFSFGQAPGYNSSLGEIKFNMPNPWSIYMHDTPHREDFVKFFRAYSSGCVRVHKPKEFATFLLRDSANYSYSKVDSICKLRKTIFVPMKRNINVHFVYLTTAIDSTGNMMYLNDVYKWDDKIIGMK